MTDWNGIATLITALFSGVSALVTAIVGAWILTQQARNRAAMADVTASVATVKTDIKELAVNTNSIRDELVKVTAKSAHAEGVLEQKDLQTLTDLKAAAAAVPATLVVQPVAPAGSEPVPPPATKTK